MAAPWLRPARDLPARILPLPADAVVDFGSGAIAEALRHRSRRMGPRCARRRGCLRRDAPRSGAPGLCDRIEQADAASWEPEAPPALIFTKALLDWLRDHDRLLPRLARLLVPGGTLAVQMPAQHDAPSHALLRRIAAEPFPGPLLTSRGLPPAVGSALA